MSACFVLLLSYLSYLLYIREDVVIDSEMDIISNSSNLVIDKFARYLYIFNFL